jgi:hypothetical protein
MTLIEEIVERLQKYPQLSFRVQANSIQVDSTSSTGFSISLICGRAGYTVCFDGWHEEFSSEEDALNCFAFGLSDECRLKVARRGRIESSWTVEYRDGQNWVEDSTTGLLLIPFWRRREFVYRQNDIIRRDGNASPTSRSSWRKEPE